MRDSKMNVLTDGVALRIVDRGVLGLDVGSGKGLLEVMASEFCAIIMETLEGAGVATEPLVVKLRPRMFGGRLGATVLELCDICK